MDSILIVEDSQFDAELVSRAINAMPQEYYLEVVPDAETGLRQMFNPHSNYNLVISDHSLPGISGLEFCQMLRKNGYDIPFILMTCAGSEAVAVETLKSGGTDYMVKDASGTFAEKISKRIPELHKSFVTSKIKKRINEKLMGEVTSLRRQVSDLEAYAQMVSNELKAPLVTLLGYAHAIAESSPADAQSDLATLSSRLVKLGKRSVGIVDAMLAFSMAESAPVQMGKVDMQMVLHNVMVRLADAINLHQVQLHIDQPILNCYGYSPWVEEIWYNYISNAIKFGGRPSKVIISSVLEGNQVCYWVTDNGYGIDDHDLDRVFEPFYRVATHHSRGSGLGLSIVKRIVERLDGQVGARSQTGLGSSFYFALPYLKPESFREKPDRYSDVDRVLRYRDVWRFE